MGVGIGVGVNSVFSKKFGEQDEKGVRSASGNGLFLSSTGSAVLVWLAFPIMEILRFIMAVIFTVRTHRQLIKPIM